MFHGFVCSTTGSQQKGARYYLKQNFHCMHVGNVF
jgi:hypothetical protein